MNIASSKTPSVVAFSGVSAVRTILTAVHSIAVAAAIVVYAKLSPALPLIVTFFFNYAPEKEERSFSKVVQVTVVSVELINVQA
jgi:hypothetical protein